MNYFKRLLTSITLLIACSAAFAHTPANAQQRDSIAPMLAKVTPSVVNISVEKKVPKDLEMLAKLNILKGRKLPKYISAVGSGVIFNAHKGLIVTNAHVVKDAKVMLVTLKDGRRYRAKLIAAAKDYDVAIIKINAHNLSALKFSNSNQLKVGDFVAAIGSPYGLNETVTSGVVSALNRVHPQVEGYQSFIQTDAPINPGNSGGALVNMQGQLVGINTAIITPTYGSIGIGFAIPSNMVHAVIEQLITYGKVERGMLGVLAQNITPALASAMHLKQDRGDIITKVVPNSPAEKAGIKVGDVIAKINDIDIYSASQLRNTLGLMRPGTDVHFTVLRDGKTRHLTATIGDPKVMKPRIIPFLSGMSLQTYDELQSDGSEVHGVLVKDLSETSPGSLAGLRKGDVITQANGTHVNSLEQLMTIAMSSKKHLLLSVTHGQNTVYVVIENDE